MDVVDVDVDPVGLSSHFMAHNQQQTK